MNPVTNALSAKWCWIESTAPLITERVESEQEPADRCGGREADDLPFHRRRGMGDPVSPIGHLTVVGTGAALIRHEIPLRLWRASERVEALHTVRRKQDGLKSPPQQPVLRT